MITRAPSCKKSFAVENPIPAVDPVTSTKRSLSPRFMQTTRAHRARFCKCCCSRRAKDSALTRTQKGSTQYQTLDLGCPLIQTECPNLTIEPFNGGTRPNTLPSMDLHRSIHDLLCGLRCE